MSISLEQAEQIIEAAKAKANEIEVPMTIAVVDAGGNLVALARMDTALLASLDIATGKAYTACAMKMSTADLASAVQPGQPLYGLETSNQPRPLVTFGEESRCSLTAKSSEAWAFPGGCQIRTKW
jgi:cob(I)alamin adenosyltransferase